MSPILETVSEFATEPVARQSAFRPPGARTVRARRGVARTWIMTAAGARIDVGAPVATGRILMAGIVLACLTDAIASTILAPGRADIIGDTYATPDAVAWLDVGYTAFKLIGLVFAPWLLTRVDPRRLLLIATLVIDRKSTRLNSSH